MARLSDFSTTQLKHELLYRKKNSAYAKSCGEKKLSAKPSLKQVADQALEAGRANLTTEQELPVVTEVFKAAEKVMSPVQEAEPTAEVVAPKPIFDLSGLKK